MRKYILFVSSFVVVFASAHLLFRQHVRQETFRAIHLKSSKTEVRGLLGGPLATPDRTRKLPWGGTEEIWFGKDGAIIIAFDPNDTLTFKEWVNSEDTVYLTPIDH